MNTQEFLDLLAQNKDAALLFEYAPNLLVGANYHLTEVKHTKIDSVDCGGRTDAWNETIVQLYESPDELGKTLYMTAGKALRIMERVGKLKPFDLEAVLKIEYSNPRFHTAQLFIDSYVIKNKQLLLKLMVNPTDCKAKDACGVPAAAAVNQEANACAPGSGCC